jgi:periplasmic copper chaperone A
MRFVAAVALLLSALTLAVPASAQTVAVEQPWARATAPNATTGATYLSLTAATADRLIGAASPVAAMAQVHEMAMDAGVMRMREVGGGLALPAGKKVTLAPGGYHLMLMGLKHQLKPGERFPLTLSFAHAPALTVEVVVGAPGASAAPMGGMQMH